MTPTLLLNMLHELRFLLSAFYQEKPHVHLQNLLICIDRTFLLLRKNIHTFEQHIIGLWSGDAENLLFCPVWQGNIIFGFNVLQIPGY